MAASYDSKAAVDTDYLYQHIGRRIASRRQELGVTQTEVGGRIGLSRASIANIERGHQRLALHQVYQLADALGLRAIDLLPADQPVAPDTDISISGASDFSDAALRQINQIYNMTEPAS